ncbi:helix-turn-helix transcriptional regulator [Paenibacillus sp. NFR01]|uniref:helix-turn-helix transcriptional regulator n=1 Tax=Paenibacillus sp. NFR01 TaxID=1566279 RepID=UPI0008C83A54|nr:helix-turn-helix transcriptional regulator [Paenibacillus sp. NFR01]SET11190.1 Helix-turn-helix domain-containing protein [Paenibacillus sp. NFR01]
MDTISSRASLGDFLRLRRERLAPEEAGITVYGRRRTPGLRREEVAQLAHIGTSWYTSLEQGRDVHPSEDVLNNIAKALRLSEDERRHLLLLARPAQQQELEDTHMNAGLERMVAALEPNPAFVLGRGWDLLLWNKAAELVFRFPPVAEPGAERPNWMRLFLTNQRPDVQDKLAWAKRIISRFRADYAHFPNDPRFIELIEEFTRISPVFREQWPLHDVQTVAECHKQWFDSRIGDMEFDHLILCLPSHPGLQVMVYTATPETAERLERSLGKLAALETITVPDPTH